MGIFPEGDLSPLNGGWGTHRPHTGAARLSLSTGAPIVPVGISLPPEHGRTFEVKQSGEKVTGRWCFRGPYTMTIGEAMHFDGDVEDHEYVRSVSRDVMRRIDSLLYESARRVQDSQAVADCPSWLKDTRGRLRVGA